MSLTKKAQWIVWEGRKSGRSTAEILTICESKGVTDAQADLVQAIESRPYQPQPQRVYHASKVNNPFAALTALIAQVADPEQRKVFEAALAQKIEDKRKAIEAEKQQAVLGKIEAALKSL